MNTNNTPKKHIYIDMDNVLVDFDSALALQSDETLKEYEGRYDEIPGLFAQMQPMTGAKAAVKDLEQRNYDLYILSTAPWNNPSAWSDKLEWVKRHFGNTFYKRLILSHHKDLCKGDYLIDDRAKNGAAEFEGEWLQFGSDKFPDWDSVLKYFGIEPNR